MEHVSYMKYVVGCILEVIYNIMHIRDYILTTRFVFMLLFMKKVSVGLYHIAVTVLGKMMKHTCSMFNQLCGEFLIHVLLSKITLDRKVQCCIAMLILVIH